MRSAELSGVGEQGFGASRVQAPASGFGGTNALKSALRALSPVTLAIVLTAIVAVALFIATDHLRTGADLEQRREMIGRLASMQPLSARQFAGPFDARMLVDDAHAFDGVAQRGALALALLMIVVSASMRRRPGPTANADLARFRDLLSTIPFGVACWTNEGGLIASNDQYGMRLRLEPGQIRAGMSYKASVARLTEGGYVRMVNEDDQSRVLELHREDGSCLLIDERPLSDGGFVTLVTDITEQRRTDHLLTSMREEQRVLARRYHEEKLRAEAASRSKTSFLAHLSHDIRTPLNHIIGFADLIGHETYGPMGDARYAGYVEDIKGSGERLLSFFSSILDLAELESGKRVLEESAVSVDELLAGVHQRFAAPARQAGLILRRPAPSAAWLRGDRYSLERMLGNLVENAIRFTPRGGRITVASHLGSDGVVIEITDTGIGIPAERLSALSQPFAFGDASLTKQRSGAGLGLAIARSIAELSGGHLAIDSRPSLGTTVAISLPLLIEDAGISAAA